MTRNMGLAKGEDGDGKACGPDPQKSVPQKPVVRFAPSPNGLLHLGHVFSALFTAEVAEALGARLLLRIDDIDHTRCTAEFEARIYEDLAWLGLTWEEPVRRQSDHMAEYQAALEILVAKGLLFPSRASRRQVRAAVAVREADGEFWPLDPDGGPHYPRASLRAIDEGQGPKAMRLDMAKALAGVPPLFFDEIGSDSGPGLDASKQTLTATPQVWGDVNLARKDIHASYHIGVVVDDAVQGATHITRGADLAPATHLHRLLQFHLGLPTPVYCHHGLLLDGNGGKLAKSLRSEPLREQMAAGQTRADIRRACGIDQLAPYFDALALHQS